jgi:uncharacterized protein with ATP-grasp and redox domains
MLNRNLKKIRPLGTEAQALAFTKEFLRIFLDAPEDKSTPWFAPMIADLMHKHYGLPLDRFREEKIASNRFVMERMDSIREKVFSAPDPVFAGLQFAILGNYLDFSALQDAVSFEKLDEMLDQALEMELDAAVYSSLCRELETGSRLLYLTDNAGEIGFDRVCAEAIAARYPHLQITFCVRGGNTLNDATRADAQEVEIPFPVIDSGVSIPGTLLSTLGEEAKQALETADVIIAKGQGNAETLLDSGYNIYFAFLVKCIRFEERFNKPKLTPMLVRERD